MLEYLRKKLADSDGFTIDVWLVGDDAPMTRCGLYGADAAGLAFEHNGADFVAPWPSVHRVTIDE